MMIYKITIMNLTGRTVSWKEVWTKYNQQIWYMNKTFIYNTILLKWNFVEYFIVSVLPLLCEILNFKNKLLTIGMLHYLICYLMDNMS